MYAKIVNNQIVEFPIEDIFSALKKEGMEVGRDADLSKIKLPSNIIEVTHDGFPSYDSSSEKLSLSQLPEFKNGKWYEKWQVVKLTDDEKLFMKDRLVDRLVHQRNEKLSASDWTQLPDSPVSNKQEWTVYRQALRNLSSQSGWPNDVIWPTEPK